ncbi:C6 transcription factor [Cladophialophora carrionii]|uniref:C6 transcription factor n=1 Tax=Cladophialophora carrionii TaxID=86049 RepID=A0A1C1D070_9EURO|nr:C6 transcription factor [Cladophialophora carrionii]
MPDGQSRRPSEAEAQGQDPATPPQPSYKRRRIALACTSCRNRKSRCNGARPACSLCVELGFECVYQQPAAGTVKPVQPTSDYDERLRAIEETLRLLVNQKVTFAGEGERPVQSSPDQNSSPRRVATSLHPPRQASNDDEDVAILDEGDLVQPNAEDSVDGMAAITDPEETESRFFGPSSNIALLRHISDATSATLRAIGQSRHSENEVNQSIVSRVASPVTTTLSETSPIARQHINVRSLPAEARAQHLIKLFFSDTGMLFPYIHEQDILRTYSTARQNRFTAVSRSWLCLVNVIFAFATYISARPDQSAEKNAAESEIFIERAQALSAEIEMKTASLETVQCLLLMAQYRQGTQRSDQAWNLHGLAVRAAIQLGLHSRTASAGLSPVEAEIRKRTWFGCMILDRTLSMTFGRPCMMPNCIVKLDLPVNQNLEKLTMLGGSLAAPSRLDPPDTVCFFTATIQLYYVLGDIISELYADNVDVDAGLAIPTIVERTVVLEQKLAAWKHKLLPQLLRRPWDTLDPEGVSVSTWDPVFDRLSVILTLRYLNTRILLHRPILSAFLRQRSGPRTAESLAREDPFFNDLGDRSVRICQQSAMEIVDIVYKTSKPPALLGAWWFTAYYTFNAALVIFSCILLELTSHHSETLHGSYMIALQSPDPTKFVEMIIRLRRAMEALKRFGEGTKSAKRIRKTLLKLMQICMTLVQSNPELGPVALSALATSQQGESAQSTGQSGAQVQPQGVVDGSAAINGVVQNLGPDDPFAFYDMGMQPYWADNSLDLFADLVGVEPGLTAMMAG